MESENPRWNLLDEQDKARIDALINNQQKEFPVELFPIDYQKVINYMSTDLNLNKDICSVGVLATLGSAIGLKASINTDFINYPIQWIAVVAKSGYGKTPALSAAIKPLRKLDQKAAVTYSAELEAYKSSAMPIPKPKLSQRIVSNFTIEALLDVHKYNKNGLLIYVDELMGFINSFGQYKSGKSNEQEIYLAMHDAEPIVLNRKTSDPVTLNESCLSILGGMQPSKLFDFLRDGRAEDGFLFRFCFVYIRDQNEDEEDKGKVNESIEKEYESLIRQIAEFSFNAKYQLEEKAEQIFRYWKSQCRRLYRDDEFDFAYQNKLVKMVLRFALISHTADEYRYDNPINIPASTMLKAIKTAEYFRYNLNIMMEDKYDNDISIDGNTITKILVELRKLNQFQRKDALPVFLDHGYCAKTMTNYLGNPKYFKRIRHGFYETRRK
jgi:hypothetical protein